MTVSDLLLTLKIFIYTGVTWCVPPRYWRRLASASVFKTTQKFSPICAAILTQRYSEGEISRIWDRRRGYSRELRMQILGMNGLRRGWCPNILLTGRENIDRALQHQRGAILWVIETSFSTLHVKIALHRAGYHQFQLSRAGHGFSAITPFCRRYLNPIWTRVEDRFIRQRVLITGQSAEDAFKTLRVKLAENGIVLITLVPLAHKFADMPFFQGVLEVPTGPVRFAFDTGASLLPVFSFVRPDGNFEVSVEPEIYSEAEARDSLEVLTKFGKKLEAFVLNYPDQWTGWDWLASRMHVR